jgi:hypothetical protein
VTADAGRTGATGFTAAGGGGVTLGAAGTCCFSRIALISPGFEMCEKSNFGFNSSSPCRFEAGRDDEPSPPPWRKCALTFSASSTLIELE